MQSHMDARLWKTQLFEILEETFEHVQGIYLDPGTSLFETLASITPDEASRSISAHGASIAAQVNHVRYYLDVLSGYMSQQPPERVDWPASWQVTTVSAAEWDDLRQSLRDSYQRVRSLVETFETWDGEEDISGTLAIVVHTAYHLGEIRQALGILRG